MTTTRLLLMRHAKSDRHSGEREDFLRPLNERGVRDARAMGQWLAQSGFLPETILSSPSRRTRDTLRLLGEGAGRALDAITHWSDQLYLASASELRNVLAAQPAPGAAGIMVLAHNPGLEELLEWLLRDADQQRGAAKRFPTGAIYVLDIDQPLDALSRAGASLVAHQRPRDLTS